MSLIELVYCGGVLIVVHIWWAKNATEVVQRRHNIMRICNNNNKKLGLENLLAKLMMLMVFTLKPTMTVKKYEKCNSFTNEQFNHIDKI